MPWFDAGAQVPDPCPSSSFPVASWCLSAPPFLLPAFPKPGTLPWQAEWFCLFSDVCLHSQVIQSVVLVPSAPGGGRAAAGGGGRKLRWVVQTLEWRNQCASGSAPLCWLALTHSDLLPLPRARHREGRYHPRWEPPGVLEGHSLLQENKERGHGPYWAWALPGCILRPCEARTEAGRPKPPTNTMLPLCSVPPTPLPVCKQLASALECP